MTYLNRDAVLRDLQETLERLTDNGYTDEYHNGFVDGFEYCLDQLREHKTVQHRKKVQEDG